MRYIGVDLHKTNFVVCFLSADETTYTETYPLTKLGLTRFISQLEAEDEVAVEVTANIYYFDDQVKPHVRRIVLVDTYRFAVIARSKKKTDKADAAALARFLKLDYLPGVSVPSPRVRQLRHLLQARETLVGMRTKLKNMAHGALTRNGLALSRSAFASRLSRTRLAKREDLAAADVLIMQAALRQIEELDREVEAVFEDAPHDIRWLPCCGQCYNEIAMSTKTATPVTALDAQAAANLFLFDHLSDRFLADDPRLDEAGDVWHVPVLLTYAVLGPVGTVGEVLVNASTQEIISHTPLSEMKESARSLYEQHRDAIEAPLS